ncbi:YdcF family protein [bacterium]|nr:YdcF family protein [bacterium]
MLPLELEMNLNQTLRNGKTKLFLFGLVLLMTLAFLILFCAGEIYRYHDTVQGSSLPEVDAIVCLAGGRGRLSAASQVWYTYAEQAQLGLKKVPVLYLSGVGPQSNWPQLAWQLKPGAKFAKAKMISPENVVFENESLNTSENAKILLRYAQSKRWKKILLMTSSYHMKRAQFIFNHILTTQESPVEVETLTVIQEPFTTQAWITDWNGARVTLFEYFKLLYYRSLWSSF